MRFPLPCKNFATSYAALLVSLDSPTTAHVSIRSRSAMLMPPTLGERLVAASHPGQVTATLLVRRTDGDQQQAGGAEGEPAGEGGGVRREQVQRVDRQHSGADGQRRLQPLRGADQQDDQRQGAEQQR